MAQDRFNAMLEATAKTWKAYAVALGVLYLGMVIDFLGPMPFFKGEAPIDVGGFKVVREALSATYGLLFTVFVVTVFFESRRLLQLVQSMDLSGLRRSITQDLWLLSPFSEVRALRAAFWLLFADGFVLLAVFSYVHLALHWPPDAKRMSALLYQGIGLVDLVLLVAVVPLGYLTFTNLRQVQQSIRQLPAG